MQKRLLAFLFASFCFLSSYSQDQCSPVGWATQNGGTTGGGTAAPVTVTTLSALQSQASSSGAKVIYVSGTMGSGVSTRVSVASNKTIIGLPGAKLIGGFDVGASNIIIRNMIIQGPGAVDVNGVDCITIDGGTNVWIDHCELYDGQDGNMDIVNGSNYVAVTWCKFRYTSASSNHQFCNLFGNSDSKTSDRGKLRITLMYNWWTAGCKERMPRVRFGQVHVVNNYYNCTGNNHCVRAGKEADLLVESNYFDGVSTPIDLYQNNFTAVTSRNNTLVSTSGNSAGSGTAFTPPYTLTITPSANVKSLVLAAAGATMPSPTSCSGSVTNYTLTATSSPTAGGSVSGAGSYASGTVVTVTATPAAGYTFSGWSGDASGTTTSTTVTMSANRSVTANFAVIPPTTYTLTTTATPAAGGTVSGAGTYNSGTVVSVTATPAAGYTFTGWSGDASGTATSTTVTMSTNKSVTANFAAISPTTYTLTTAASPAAGGSVSGAGTYASGTVVTVTATAAAGYTFANWSGDASGTSTSTTVTMSANKSITANFAVIPPTTYTLTTAASPTAGGTVSGGGTYASGTAATVTATPAAGYIFVNWSGDASGTNTTTTVMMSANKSATANFQLSGGGTTTIRIEDNATTSTGLCLIEGAVSSNSGANNTKVINLTNTVGKGVNWRVNVPSAGSYTLNWRYANSSTSNTFSMKFILNGVVVNAALPFPKTNGSSIFLNTIVTVTLNAGNNDIRLESIASNATADIDWIEITGNGPVAGNCTAARPAPAVSIIEEANQKAGVYPNPAKGKVTVGFYLPAADKVNINIVSADGKKIVNAAAKLFTAGYNKQEFNLDNTQPGIYNVVIAGDKGIKYIFKLIIQ